MARHNELGQWGEDLAAEHYTAAGYCIRERNWRMNHLEVDLIVTRGDRIVFVEVKTRAADDFADPSEALTDKKIAHLVSAANVYMRNMPDHEDLDWQFDLFLVVGTPGSYTTECIEDAFYPPQKRMCR